MTTIRWEMIPETTREFIRAVTATPEGAVIEEDGRPSYRLIAYTNPVAGATTLEWTAADNQRRGVLIDKDLEGKLTPDERVELEHLEQRLEQHVDAVAPLPLGPLRRLYQEVLVQACGSNGTSPS